MTSPTPTKSVYNVDIEWLEPKIGAMSSRLSAKARVTGTAVSFDPISALNETIATQQIVRENIVSMSATLKVTR